MAPIKKAKDIAFDKRTLSAVIALLTILLGAESETIQTAVGLPSRQEAEAEPVPVINADKTYDVGDLIILDATASTGTHFSWSVIPDNSEKPTFWFSPDEPLILHLASRPGTYAVTLIASNCNGNQSTTVTIPVTGGPSSPGPGPGPGPNPPAPVPDGKYQLASFAKSQALSVPEKYQVYGVQIAALIDRLENDTKLKNSNEFAAAFVSGLKTILNSEESLTAWRPWYNAIRDRLIALETENKFTNYADYKTAWNEISKGLKSL